MRVYIFFNLLVALVGAIVPVKDYKPNVFVLTDIGNEPDDSESLVRLFLYTNEINLHGIVATTSQWLNDTTHEELIYPVIDAYEQVYENLQHHSDQYPPADYFKSIIGVGHPVFGLAALENDTLSSGATNLIEKIDELGEVDDYLYILVWGGANVIAEALNHLSQTRSAQEVDAIVSRLSVYSISDQDNSGIWLRFTYPHLRYIASTHAYGVYGISTWLGISADDLSGFDKGGPDYSYVSDDWVKEHIQNVGPLGEQYLDRAFTYEGDTPSTLSVLPNGLNVPSHPEYGGWGGRYGAVDPSLNFNHFADTQDTVVGVNGQNFTSDKASIWRWRPEYQSNFANRMQWTVKSFDDVAHEPIIQYEGKYSVLQTEFDVQVGSNLTLDISESYDLNGKELSYNWIHYNEISGSGVGKIEINPQNEQGSIVSFTIPSKDILCVSNFKPTEVCKETHIIAQVSNGEVSSYKRFIVFAHL